MSVAALFASNSAQRALADLPILSATRDVLADEDVTRASVVLSALAHAYWRFGADRFFPQRITQVPGDLPKGLAMPWRELAARLGRSDPARPFQSFYDLFLANYRLASHARLDAPRVIENLEVLVPSFRNEAERIFYMSFVDALPLRACRRSALRSGRRRVRRRRAARNEQLGAHSGELRAGHERLEQDQPAQRQRSILRPSALVEDGRHPRRTSERLQPGRYERGLRAHAPPDGRRAGRDRELPTIRRASVARHHRSGDLWLIIDDGVYDVSNYVEKHPGGDALLFVEVHYPLMFRAPKLRRCTRARARAQATTLKSTGGAHARHERAVNEP